MTGPRADNYYPHSQNQSFTRSQYFLRNDLLVAPALFRESKGPKNQYGQPVRYVYLPSPDGWYTMNLRPDEQFGVPLGQKEDGGKKVQFDCHISDDAGHIPYVNPMYIREGKHLSGHHSSGGLSTLN